MNVRYLVHTAKRFGLGAVGTHATIAAVGRVVPLRVLRCLALDARSPILDPEGGGYAFGFIPRHALLEAIRRSAGEEMSEAFVDHALARGHRCFGATRGGEVASFAWYATDPTPVDEGLEVSFAPDLLYMYKAYTAPQHRGRRLHAACVTRALDAYARAGVRAMLCYVEAQNFRSLRAHRAAGYAEFGRIVTVELEGRYLVHESEGCRRYGVTLVPCDAPRAVVAA